MSVLRDTVTSSMLFLTVTCLIMSLVISTGKEYEAKERPIIVVLGVFLSFLIFTLVILSVK